MKKLTGFIKKYWILIMLVLAGILYVINFFLKGPISPVTPTPTPINKIAAFGSLIPGVSNENDVLNVLGRPIDTKTENGLVTSQYKSTNQYRFNKVIFTNGTTKLIKEIVNSNDNKDASSITSIYGAPQYTLYEKLSNSVFNLYVYPQNRIAYLGATDGTLKEIWYFEPTTIDNFIKDWGQDFETTPVGEKDSAY